MLDSYFKNILNNYQKDFRYVISTAVNLGVPVPGFSSALMYYDSYRSANLPANLLQAQRDYFGAHTFERTDKEGIFHHEWVIVVSKNGAIHVASGMWMAPFYF